MPCFNHGEFLPEDVASVMNARREDLELICGRRRLHGRANARGDERSGGRAGEGDRQKNKGLAGARMPGSALRTENIFFPLDADAGFAMGSAEVRMERWSWRPEEFVGLAGSRR